MLITLIFAALRIDVDHEGAESYTLSPRSDITFTTSNKTYKLFFRFLENDLVFLNTTMTWDNSTSFVGKFTQKNVFSFDGEKIIIHSTSAYDTDFDVYSLKSGGCDDDFAFIFANEKAYKVSTTFKPHLPGSLCIFMSKNKYQASVYSFSRPSSTIELYSNGTYYNFTDDPLVPEVPYHFKITDPSSGMNWYIEGNQSSPANPFDYICETKRGGKYRNGEYIEPNPYEMLIQCSGSTPTNVWRYAAFSILGIALVLVTIFVIWKLHKWCARRREERYSNNASRLLSNEPLSVNLNEPSPLPPDNYTLEDPEKSVVFFKRKNN